MKEISKHRAGLLKASRSLLDAHMKIYQETVASVKDVLEKGGDQAAERLKSFQKAAISDFAKERLKLVVLKSSLSDDKVSELLKAIENDVITSDMMTVQKPKTFKLFQPFLDLIEQALRRTKDKTYYADCVVRNKDGKVLITKRYNGDDTNPGKWCLPGGHVEAGESASQAAKRELFEETGIQALSLKLLHSKATDTAFIDYFEVDAGDLTDSMMLLQGIEAQNYVWIGEDEVDDYVYLFDLGQFLKDVVFSADIEKASKYGVGKKQIIVKVGNHYERRWVGNKELKKVNKTIDVENDLVLIPGHTRNWPVNKFIDEYKNHIKYLTVKDGVNPKAQPLMRLVDGTYKEIKSQKLAHKPNNEMVLNVVVDDDLKKLIHDHANARDESIFVEPSMVDGATSVEIKGEGKDRTAHFYDENGGKITSLEVGHAAVNVKDEFSLKDAYKQLGEKIIMKADTDVQDALDHPDELGEGAKKRKKLKSKKDKVSAVMKEFGRGTLHSGDGKIVTDRKQAIAIAMSEAGIEKDEEKAMKEDAEDQFKKASIYHRNEQLSLELFEEIRKDYYNTRSL